MPLDCENISYILFQIFLFHNQFRPPCKKLVLPFHLPDISQYSVHHFISLYFVFLAEAIVETRLFRPHMFYFFFLSIKDMLKASHQSATLNW